MKYFIGFLGFLFMSLSTLNAETAETATNPMPTGAVTQNKALTHKLGLPPMINKKEIKGWVKRAITRMDSVGYLPSCLEDTLTPKVDKILETLEEGKSKQLVLTAKDQLTVTNSRDWIKNQKKAAIAQAAKQIHQFVNAHCTKELTKLTDQITNEFYKQLNEEKGKKRADSEFKVTAQFASVKNGRTRWEKSKASLVKGGKFKATTTQPIALTVLGKPYKINIQLTYTGTILLDCCRIRHSSSNQPKAVVEVHPDYKTVFKYKISQDITAPLTGFGAELPQTTVELQRVVLDIEADFERTPTVSD